LVNADLEYEYGGDRTAFDSQLKRYENSKRSESESQKSYGAIFAQTFTPGIYKACNLDSNASIQDYCTAYGEAAFDVVMLAPLLRCAGSALRALGAVGTVAEAATARTAIGGSRLAAIKEIVKSSPLRKRFSPDLMAEGPHTRFRTHGETGKVNHYETFQPQTNPRNPNPWESIKRFDGCGDSHYNNVLEERIFAPHMHDPHYPGKVRPPYDWEIPKRGSL
jgi:hypothetical protein